jgi:hypothetical protein
MIHGKDYTITLDAGEIATVDEAFGHTINLWRLDAEKTGEPKCLQIAENYLNVWQTIRGQGDLSDNAAIKLKACDIRAMDEALEVASKFLPFAAKQSGDPRDLELAEDCLRLRQTILAQVNPQDKAPIIQ